MTKKQILLLTIILGAANNIALAMEKTTKQQKKLNKKLILAISKSELDGVHYYLKKGANPNAEEIFGKRAIITPLKAASSDIHPNKDIIHLLLKEGADINKKFKDNNSTILHNLAHHPVFSYSDDKNDEIVSIVTAAGLPIDAQDINGNTAAHIAATYCNYRILQGIAKNNGNFNLKNKMGEIPLDIAKESINSADAGAFYFVSHCGAPRPISLEKSDCQITMA